MDPRKIAIKLQHTLMKESVQSGLPAWVLILILDSVKTSLLVGLEQEEVLRDETEVEENADKSS